MKINVGIDLGTTYSACATFSKENGRVQVFKNSFDKECTPSVVWIDGGKAYIDCSEYVSTKKQALKVGKERKQLSIWDWKNSNAIPCKK